MASKRVWCLKMKVRVSIGTASFIELEKIEVKAPYSTAYLMSALPCIGKCKYCPQSVGEYEKLGRITWPSYELEDVIKGLKKNPPLRICVQTQCNPSIMSYLRKLLPKISGIAPISVSIYPITPEELGELRDLGVERVGIPFDAATPKIMKRSGRSFGPISWEGTYERIEKALEVFGEWRVTTHVIVGLGETDLDVLSLAKSMYEKKVLTSLFPFFPVKGTPFERKKRPSLGRYRAIQLCVYALYKGEEIGRDFFSSSGKLIKLPKIKDAEAFTVLGCPGCNRPYYTEEPSVPYNFPETPKDPSKLIMEAMGYVEGNIRSEEEGSY